MLTWSREHSMVIAALLRRLGEIMVHERLTTPEVVDQALARAKTTGERVGEALVAMGAVQTEDVLRALASASARVWRTRAGTGATRTSTTCATWRSRRPSYGS